MSHFNNLYERKRQKRIIHMSSINAPDGDMDSTEFHWKWSIDDVPMYKRFMEAMLSLLDEGSKSNPLDFPDLGECSPSDISRFDKFMELNNRVLRGFEEGVIEDPHKSPVSPDLGMLDILNPSDQEFLSKWDSDMEYILFMDREASNWQPKALRCFLALCEGLIVPGMERYLKRFYDRGHIDEDMYLRHLQIQKNKDVALSLLSKVKSCEEIDIKQLKTEYYKQLGIDGKEDIDYDGHAHKEWRKGSHLDNTVTILMFDPFQPPKNRALALYILLLDKVSSPGGTRKFEPRKLFTQLKMLKQGKDPVADKCLEMAVDLLPPPPRKYVVDGMGMED